MVKKKVESSNDKNNKGSIKEKVVSLFKKDNDATSRYKKMRNKKNRKKRIVNGKFSIDVLDLLIIIVVTVIISSVFTGMILNFQYRNNLAYLKNDKISSEYITEFIDIYTEVVDNFYEEVDQEGMINSAIDGMLGYLEDNYSIHLNKDETDQLSQTLDGKYKGIGILAYGVTVVEVYKGSPAEKAGIKANDVILEINGNKLDNSNSDMITEFLKNDKENVVKVKRGKEELTFSVKMDDVYLTSTTHSIIENKGKRIGYVSLSSFTANSAADFQESLIELEKEKKIDSLIIDLRSNTGGYLNSASNIANIFLEQGKVIYSLDNKDGKVSYKDETKQSMTIKVVVLVNQNSASASEVLAAALKDSYGATIVGMTTFGKGTVQTTMKHGDTMIKYTSAKWLRPNGECVDGVGIKPDYEVEVEIKNNTIYDKQLEKAIELLS